MIFLMKIENNFSDSFVKGLKLAGLTFGGLSFAALKIPQKARTLLNRIRTSTEFHK